MTMLLSAWQDALRRNMAYGDRREARKAAAREQPGMLERATGAVGGALMKIMNPDDPEMARLKLQLQHQAARDAAQRQFQAEAEGREAKRRIEEMRAGHGYKMEEYGAFKPTPEQAHEQKMEWLKEQNLYKETPEEKYRRHLDAARASARERAAYAARYGTPGGGVVFNEAAQARDDYKVAQSALDNEVRHMNAELDSTRLSSQKAEIRARYAPKLAALEDTISAFVELYPHLVGKAPAPPPRRIGAGPAPRAQQRQPPVQGNGQAPMMNPLIPPQ